MLEWFLVGWPVASVVGAMFVGRCIAVGMGTREAASASQAGRTLNRRSTAADRSKKAETTARLRSELGR